MRTLIKALWLLGILLTINIMIQNDANAQAKKNPVKVSNIEVSAPMGTIEILGVSLDIHDLTGQSDLLDQHRLEDAAKGLIPRNPVMTLIKDENLGPRAYRFAETLEEAKKEDDGIQVLKIEYEVIRKNKRTRFN